MLENSFLFNGPAPFDFTSPLAYGLKGVLIAAVLAAIAAQPPYAIMVWRDIRRAWRHRLGKVAAATTSGARLVTTVDAAILLGLIGTGVAMVSQPALPVLVALALAAVLLVLALLDFRYYWLPDRLTLPLGLAGLAAALPDLNQASEGVIAALLAGSAFYALHLGYRWLRGVDGLGLGDVKLVAALGAWVGVAALSWLVLAASVSALIAAAASALLTGRRGKDGAMAATARSPFGLHLALAGWLFICLRQSASHIH